MAERSIWEQAYGRLASPDFAAPSQAVQSVRNPGPMVGRGNLSSYDFSWRDMTRQWLKSLGMSDNMVKNTMTLVDFTPAGAAFVGNEARRSYDRGERVAPAAEVALAALPLPAAVKKGASKVAREVAEEAPRTIIAYHGSPHSFDRFSLDKIGTGEGAQAYGHGLYFAENEAVARQYRDDLTARVTGGANRATIQAGGDIDAALQAAQAEAARLSAMPQSSRRDGLLQLVQQQIQELEARKIGQGATGSMYQVRIDADPADFLDWDAPLSGQSEKVRAAVLAQPEVERVIAAQSRILPDIADKMSGSGAYAAMTGWKRGADLSPTAESAAAVTQRMAEQGVAGIKYLDQGSRTAGDGSRNYVVFDDKLISILKKYGWVPGMAVPAIAVRDYTAMYGVAPDLGGEAPSVTVY